MDNSGSQQKVIGIVSLDELAQLAPGWFEGAGLAPDKERLSQFAEQLTASYPDSLMLPAIFPTQDGNLLLEWNAIGDPSLDVRLADFSASYHAFDDDGADIERDFRLDGEQGWSDLVSIVRDAATGAVEKKLQNLDISPMLREHVVDQVKAGMWEIRNSVANQIASRFTLKDLP